MAESSLQGWGMGYGKHPLLPGPLPGLRAIGTGGIRGLPRGPWVFAQHILGLSSNLGFFTHPGREILGSPQTGAREARPACDSCSLVPGRAPTELEVTGSAGREGYWFSSCSSAVPVSRGRLSPQGPAHTCPWSTSQQGLGRPLNCKAAGHLSSRVLLRCPRRR